MDEQSRISRELAELVDAQFVNAEHTTKCSMLDVCHAYIAHCVKLLCEETSPKDAIDILQGYIDAIKTGALISRN